MDFNNFSLGRDLLYLSAFLAGAGLGAFLYIFAPISESRKNNWVSAALCLLSCSFAALTGSLVVSGAAILAAVSLFAPAAVFFILGALGVRFPPAGAGVVLAAGLCTVIAGVYFLRHTRLENNPGISLQTERNGIRVHKTAPNAENWHLAEKSGTVYVEALLLIADPRYPVFGGERRGLFTGVGRDDQALFSVSRSKPLPAGKTEQPGLPGFSTRRYRLEVSAETMLPGVRYTVSFDGSDLSVSPQAWR